MDDGKTVPEQAQVDEREIMAQAAVFDELVNTDGWKLLFKLGKAQQQTHIGQMMSVSSSRDMDQFRKGAVFGIEVLLGTPTGIFEHRKTIRAARAAASGKDEGENAS